MKISDIVPARHSGNLSYHEEECIVIDGLKVDNLLPFWVADYDGLILCNQYQNITDSMVEELVGRRAWLWRSQHVITLMREM